MSYNAWLYTNANPINLTDPSGMCVYEEGDCVPLGSPEILYPPEPQEKYIDSVMAGMMFMEGLRRYIWLQDEVIGDCEESWWADMKNDEDTWKMILALAYNWESGSMRTSSEWERYHELSLEAFARKYWYFYNNYGLWGKYAFVGSMETLRRRADLIWGTNLFGHNNALQRTPIQDQVLSDNFSDVYQNDIPRVLYGTWTTAVRNLPFDFGNPDPGNDPPRLIKALRDPAGVNPSQLVYKFTDNRGATAFIETYQQAVCLDKPEKRSDGCPYECCLDYCETWRTPHTH